MTNFNLTFGPRSGPGIPGKIFISIILIIFLIGGCAVFKSMLNTIVSALASRSWPSTPCTIISGYIPEKAPYETVIRYSYACCGQTYTSHLVSINYKATNDYYDAQKILNAFPAGQPAVCRVNPADPTQSVLRIPSLAILAQLLFPMVFITIGGGGVVLLWKPGKSQPETPVVNKSKRPFLVLGAIFSVVGLVMLIFFIPMIQRYTSAQHWQTAPCTIVQSKLGTHVTHGKNGTSTTYSVDVLFRYSFNGQPHESSRYKLFTVSDSNYNADAEMVEELNRNRQQTCYVNPSDPDDAILDRSFSSLIPIVGGVALVTGVIGLFALRAGRRANLQMTQTIEN